MAAISFKCPNCDGELIFEPATQTYKCEYCGSAFSQEAFDALHPQDGMEAEEEADTQAAAEKNGQKQEAAKEARVYSCPSCGAEIVTDATTAATFCYYCHNPVILGGRLSGDFLPDKIIPFEITKEDAVKRFLEYVGRKKFVPKAFFSKKQIEMITGVYFPYWKYHAKVEGAIQGEGKKIRSWTAGDLRYTETKFYQLKREGVVSLDNRMENALQKANADLARGVMPYRFDKMQDFQIGYLSGFFAEKRDIEKKNLSDKLQANAKSHAEKMLRDTIENYSFVSVANARMRIQREEWEYCLLPVWTITYKGRNGKIYYYSMNGQTGEVCGELPVDQKKLAFVSGGVSLAILVFGLLGAFFL